MLTSSQSEIESFFTTSRTGNATYVNSDGKIANAGSNTPRLQHDFNGNPVALLQETRVTARNEYARPSSGAVGDHFSTGSGNVTVVTDATFPIETGDFTNAQSVWRVDASGGDVTIRWTGGTSGTGIHNLQMMAKRISGNGAAELSLEGVNAARGKLYAFSEEWDYLYQERVNPTSSGDELQLFVPSGSVYHINAVNLQADTFSNGRLYPRSTSFVDTSGAAATRNGDFISKTFTALDTAAGWSFAFKTRYWGGENNNCTAIDLYNSGSTNNYLYLRPSNVGTAKILSYDASTFAINRDIGEAFPTPLDFSIAGRIQDGDTKIYSEGEAVVTYTGSDLPEGVDTITFNRHNSGANNEATQYIIYVAWWDTPLNDATLANLANTRYNKFVFAMGQSDMRIPIGQPAGFGFRATATDSLETKASGTSTLILTLPYTYDKPVGSLIDLDGFTGFDGISAGQINTQQTVTATPTATTLEFDVASSTASTGGVSGGGAEGGFNWFDDGDKGGSLIFLQRYLDSKLARTKVLSGTPTTGGGALMEVNDNGDGYWWSTDGTVGTFYDEMIAEWGRVGSPTVSAITWAQWQFDEELSIAEVDSDYKPTLKALFEKLREQFPTVAIYAEMPADRDGSSDALVQAFREAYDSVADDLHYVKLIHPYKYNIGEDSPAHRNNEEDYVNQFEDDFRFVLKDMGIIDQGGTEGASITAAEFESGNSYVDVTITHDGGDDFTPTSGIKGFLITVDSVAQASASAARQDATTIRVPVDGAFSGGETVRVTYPYYFTGNSPATEFVVDNTPWEMPLRTTIDLQAIESTA